ncbi:MAG: TlpA family protein disulfide reductase [Agathobacter sp.]|nr:TlpA family protein disulfide reductase [Agathobacter sp.]
MKQNKNFGKLRIVILLALVAVMALLAVGCGKNGGNNSENNGSEAGDKVSHTISVKSVAGLAMADLDVYIYGDDQLTDLVDFASTDESGIANISLPEGGEYYITLSGVGKGYEVKDYYTFSGTTAIITLNTSLITDEDISTAVLGLGDVMYDFTVTTSEGEKITLSELLKEKKLVVLNFWYTTCSWCMTEFPIMAEAYDLYKDDIAIVALDPLDGDAAVKNFQAKENLPFYMAACPASWATVFSVSGYPTSVFIDQYGVICAVEAGAITSLRPFVSVFDHFTAEDYEQVLCQNGVSDLITQIKPTYDMPAVEDIAATINGGDIQVEYRPETEDAEFIWPFIIGEKNGEDVIYASNAGIEDSFAILYADVYLEKGQALAVDYLASTERGGDMMYVIVDDVPIFNITGMDDKETWKTCYPVVAAEDGIYEVAFCYAKDSDSNEGDDTVYIKNLRVVDESQVDTATYIPRYAAVSNPDTFEWEYADIVYNPADGYYHVGSANGPLLLVDLLGYTQFMEDNSIYLEIYDEGKLMIDGQDWLVRFTDYCSFASNATINGLCTVNEELLYFLQGIDAIYGFDEEDDKEWMQLCKYYESYGTTEELQDPILGLAPHSAYKATLGKDVATNYFYYDRAIIPRGLMAEFTPTKSGVYRITSHNESQDGVEGWIFDENRNVLLTYEHDERMYEDMDDVSMVYYMEAGKSYYIDIAFWDVYENGVITYDIEYLGATYQLFRLASPGYFTYDSDATGDEMYYTVAGGIDVVLNPADGIYYEDLGKDAKGKQIYGSKLYADFSGITGIFSNPIVTNSGVTGMIDMGGFDFSKSEYDMFVLSYYEKNNKDKEATLAELKDVWGSDYEAYYIEYQVDDV